MPAGKTLETNKTGLASDMNTIGQWGLASAIPATEDVVAGSFFYETDTKLLKQEQNGSWVSLSGADLSTADAAVGDVKDGKFFFSVEKPVKEGTMPTVAIIAASGAYPQGYHGGDGGGLVAIDADLITANIKNGITIFAVAGHTNVRDVSDANALAAEVKTARTFYAVGGAKKTGSGTKTLNAANETVTAGYYVATTLSAVDADLAVGNIKSGVTIFGFLGNYAPPVIDDVSAATISSITVDTATSTRQIVYSSMSSGFEVDLVSKSLTFAAGSKAYAVGSGMLYSNTGNVKMRLYMDGVLVGTAAASTTLWEPRIIQATRSMTGVAICKVTLWNDGGAGATGGAHGGNSGQPLAVFIGVGSFKI